MFPSITRLLVTLAKPAALQLPRLQASAQLFHSLKRIPSGLGAATQNLLVPTSPNLVQSCGFKYKTVLKRRCRECYFVFRQNRLHVMCKAHPRHKQIQVKKQEKNTWILTHATQSKIRLW